MILKKAIIFISILLITLSTSAQEEKKSEAGGPPSRDEILGFWKMVDFSARHKMNKVDPWPQPYQWFAFYADGKVFSMMTTSDGNYSQKELEQVFEVLPKDGTPTFTYNGQFIKIKNLDSEEIWGANLFAKDIGNQIKKGDLMMSLDDGSGNGNKSIIYYRLLRRLP